MAGNQTIRCPFCVDGEWFSDPKFKEPYGYPYRPAKIPCEVCNGSKAILKLVVKLHPDKEQITEKERKKILLKMTKRKGN